MYIYYTAYYLNSNYIHTYIHIVQQNGSFGTKAGYNHYSNIIIH